MIKQRPTENFDVIYLHDDALAELPDTVVAEYQKSGRDISVLGDLSKLKVKPSVFKCRPLQVKYEHLCDLLAIQASSAAWQIFKHHIIGAMDFDDDKGRPVLSFSEGVEIEVRDDCRDLIPKAVVNDIVEVIVLRAMEIGLGFTLPGQFLVMRARTKARLAVDALSKAHPVVTSETSS